MSALAHGDYVPNVVYLSLVCPTCDGDIDPAGSYEHLPAEVATPQPFLEEETRRLLRGLIELIGTELERTDGLWHLRRQRLRGYR